MEAVYNAARSSIGSVGPLLDSLFQSTATPRIKMITPDTPMAPAASAVSGLVGAGLVGAVVVFEGTVVGAVVVFEGTVVLGAAHGRHHLDGFCCMQCARLYRWSFSSKEAFFNAGGCACAPPATNPSHQPQRPGVAASHERPSCVLRGDALMQRGSAHVFASICGCGCVYLCVE